MDDWNTQDHPADVATIVATVPLTASGQRRLARSGVANVMGFGVTTLIALLLTPFLIRRMGAEGYGIWALITAAVMALQLADLGLPRALSKTTAEAWAQGRRVQVQQALATTLMLFLLVGGALVVGVVGLADVIVTHWLAVPVLWQADARSALVLVALAALPSLMAAAWAAVLEGLQRMELSNLALICGRAAFAVSAIVAVLAGYGVQGLAAAMLVGAGVQALAGWLGLYRVWGGVLVALPRWPMVQTLLLFSLPVLATHAIGLAYVPLSKLVLARYATVAAVGHYEVIANLASPLFTLAWALAMAAFPSLAAAWSARWPEGAVHLYRRALRWGVMATLPLGLFLLALAEPLIVVWLGEPVPGIGWILRIVTIGWLVDALIAPSGMALQAMGRPGAVLLAVGINGGVNALLSLLLAPCCGLAGIAVANLLSALVSSSLMLALCHRLLGLALWPAGWSVRSLTASLVLPLVWLAIGGLLMRRPSGPTWWMLAGAALVYLAFYGLCLWLWGPLGADERAWMRERVSGSLRRRRPRAVE